jgi:hypothetical protein
MSTGCGAASGSGSAAAGGWSGGAPPHPAKMTAAVKATNIAVTGRSVLSVLDVILLLSDPGVEPVGRSAVIKISIPVSDWKAQSLESRSRHVIE